MSTRLNAAVAVAAGCAVGAGVLAGAWVRRSSRLPGVPRSGGSASAGPVAGTAGSVVRQAVAWVRGTPGPQDGAGTPATSGGVIPLETVPIDQLSEWELDLLTTPDP